MSNLSPIQQITQQRESLVLAALAAAWPNQLTTAEVGASIVRPSVTLHALHKRGLVTMGQGGWVLAQDPKRQPPPPGRQG